MVGYARIRKRSLCGKRLSSQDSRVSCKRLPVSGDVWGNVYVRAGAGTGGGRENSFIRKRADLISLAAF